MQKPEFAERLLSRRCVADKLLYFNELRKSLSRFFHRTIREIVHCQIDCRHDLMPLPRLNVGNMRAILLSCKNNGRLCHIR